MVSNIIFKRIYLILNWFLCMVRDRGLVSFFCMWISKYPQYNLLTRLISHSPPCILGSVAKDQCGLCSTGHCICFYGYVTL